MNQSLSNWRLEDISRGTMHGVEFSLLWERARNTRRSVGVKNNPEAVGGHSPRLSEKALKCSNSRQVLGAHLRGACMLGIRWGVTPLTQLRCPTHRRQ